MYARIHPVKLGLAGGIIWGVVLFLMTLFAMGTGFGMFWLSQWMDVFPWFTLSAKGAFLGLLYGFAEGFVGLFLLGWLYNLFKPEKRG